MLYTWNEYCRSTAIKKWKNTLKNGFLKQIPFQNYKILHVI